MKKNRMAALGLVCAMLAGMAVGCGNSGVMQWSGKCGYIL